MCDLIMLEVEFMSQWIVFKLHCKLPKDRSGEEIVKLCSIVDIL